MGVHGFVDGTNHVLIGARHTGHVFEHFGNRLAGDGHAVAMQQTGSQQGFHDLGNATGLVQIHSQVFAAGFEVAEHRRFDAHALKVVNRPFHVCRMGNGQEVQHRVGGAAGGHDDGYRVFDGLAGHDVTGLEVFFDGLNQHLGRFFGRVHFFVVRIGHGAGVG